MSQGTLWHHQADTQEVFSGLKEAEEQEVMSTACSFCWVLKWAAAPALLEQTPKPPFKEQPQSQTAPSPRKLGNEVTSRFLGRLPHNILALTGTQQLANLEPPKRQKCPTQPCSALLQHLMGGQKPDQSCSYPPPPAHSQSPQPP